MQLPLDQLEEYFREVAREAVKEAIEEKEQQEEIAWNMEKFRKECCFNHSAAWVKLFIFDQFRDEIIVNGKKGWLIPACGRGSSYKIFAKEARQWVDANKYRIDWNEKLPRG